MVKIRLKRFGTTKRPTYRVVVCDSRTQRDGRVLEELGFYNPRTEPATLNISEEKAIKWLRQGAQPTETVRALLRKAQILDKLQPAAK